MTRRLMAVLIGLALTGLVLGAPQTGKKGKQPKQSQKSSQPAATVKVGAIFAMTGGAANLGMPEARTAEAFVENYNKTIGPNGPKIQLIVKDSASTPAQAISLAKQLIDEEKVLAIVGPSTSGETMGIKNICQEGKTILISCAAAEDIVNPMATYVFKTPQKDSDAVRRIYETMKDLKISKIGVVASNDGFGVAGGKQLAALASEYGITIATSEVYDKAETDLTGVLTKVKGANVQAVVNWSIVPAQSLVAKNMKQIGLNVPLFQSHGFGNIKYVQAGGEAAEGTIFPCGRLLIAESLPGSNPQKKLLTEYGKDYQKRYKEDPSTFGGHAYDAMLVLTEALKKAGSTDPEAVRAAIEKIQGLAGTGGVFNFSATDHNGLDKNAFEMLTVKNGKFIAYKPKK